MSKTEKKLTETCYDIGYLAAITAVKEMHAGLREKDWELAIDLVSRDINNGDYHFQTKHKIATKYISIRDHNLSAIKK